MSRMRGSTSNAALNGRTGLSRLRHVVCAELFISSMSYARHGGSRAQSYSFQCSLVRGTVALVQPSMGLSRLWHVVCAELHVKSGRLPCHWHSTRAPPTCWPGFCRPSSGSSFVFAIARHPPSSPPPLRRNRCRHRADMALTYAIIARQTQAASAPTARQREAGERTLQSSGFWLVQVAPLRGGEE